MAIQRKGGKKNRKHGRNSRKPGSARQSTRTARNKARRMLHQEQLAGRRLPWPPASTSLSKSRSLARELTLSILTELRD